MAHFSEETWADFVRGICDAKTKSEINSHLDRKCRTCVPAFETWKQVSAAATHEISYAPPEDVVRMAKQEFAVKHASEPAQWSVAKLVFDTLAQPLAAGVRSGTAKARQLVYEAEGLTVDLRLDTHPRSKRVSAVGQVFDKRFATALGHAAVVLWTNKGNPILETRANERGEFQLEFEAQPELRISIEAGGRMPIRIPLAPLT